MLTLEKLKDMLPEQVFASGIEKNNPQGIFMTSDPKYKDKELVWVAIRGGYYDWCIVTHWKERGFKHAATNGDKVTKPDTIKRLVPCTDEAFKMYRS